MKHLASLLILASSLHAATIDAGRFGAKPNDAGNDLPALRQALAAAIKQGAGTLRIAPGCYVIADDEAIALQDKVMSGAMGNPQNVLFNRDFKYVTGLDFSGAKNLTVEAKGVEFVVDGWMEPVSLQNCEGVTINGLGIDYKRPPNSSGRIIAVGDGTVDVKFADWCPVHAKTPFIRMMAYDEDEKHFIGGEFTPEGVEVIAPQTLRFKLRAGQCKVGRSLVGTHGFHFRPAILLYLTKDTTLNDVSVHAQPGMGVVGHMAENTVFNRLRVVPKPGRHLPCNTDATHFVSCRGLLRFEGCEFAGQGDDATNVHIFDTDILAKGSDNTCSLGIDRRFETHSVKRDFPRVGDILAIVDRRSLREIGTIEVAAVTLGEKDFSYQIRYRGQLPEDIRNYTVANVSASARLEFLNCKVRSHRARSVLVKTRNVRIEGNEFEGSTGTCIHVGAEGDWMEGPGSSDVVIRNNVIRNCGLGGDGDGVLEGASGVALHVKAQDRSVPGIHRRVLIENNRITGGRHAIVVRGSEDVTIRNNEFIGITADPVSVAASEGVWSYSNKGSADGKQGAAPMFPGLVANTATAHPEPAGPLIEEAARINYPRIFGVRPGSPFLFRVPVSGTRPLMISAKGLPEGLALNPETGVVTGTIKDPAKKTHTVTFTAANALGSQSQNIRFVVGDRICLTPPMGWNSWYVWSEPVSERHIRAAADSFERHGLPGHGWTYINIDDCWQGYRGGKDNAIQPNEKFPDMAGMVGYLHERGIKAGIYTVPFISSYAGFVGSTGVNPEGDYTGLPPEKRIQPGQIFGRSPNGNKQFGYYRIGPHWFFDRDIAQIAGWGFDLVKFDWNPNDVPTTTRASRDVRAQKRDIALSLSNAATFAHAADYARLAELWRTTGDIEDHWHAVYNIAKQQGRWGPYAGPGHWNDPDMLQIGRTNTANLSETTSRPTRLTPPEQRTQFSLWCMYPAPLLLSCDLDRLDGETLALLTNDEVIAINQDALGKAATTLPNHEALEILRKQLEDGSVALCLVNTGDRPCDLTVPWNALGLGGPHSLRDVWSRNTLSASVAGLDVTLPPHACLLLRTAPNPVLVTPATAVGLPQPEVRLDSLKPVSYRADWGRLGIGKSAAGKPLSIAGRSYQNGIGTHANAELVYQRDPAWGRFVALLGIDDGALDGPSSIRGTLTAVNAAGARTPLAASPVLRKGGTTKHPFDVRLPNDCAQLVLTVDNAGDGNDSDHADWADAGFLR